MTFDRKESSKQVALAVILSVGLANSQALARGEDEQPLGTCVKEAAFGELLNFKFEDTYQLNLFRIPAVSGLQQSERVHIELVKNPPTTFLLKGPANGQDTRKPSNGPLLPPTPELSGGEKVFEAEYAVQSYVRTEDQPYSCPFQDLNLIKQEAKFWGHRPRNWDAAPDPFLFKRSNEIQLDPGMDPTFNSKVVFTTSVSVTGRDGKQADIPLRCTLLRPTLESALSCQLAKAPIFDFPNKKANARPGTKPEDSKPVAPEGPESKDGERKPAAGPAGKK